MIACRWILFSMVSFGLSACGATQFIDQKKSDERGAQKAQLTSGKDCYQLGHGKTPFQGETPFQGKPGGRPIIIDEPDIIVHKPHPGVNPCLDGEEPNPFPPKGHPGQYPDDCGFDCEPCPSECDDDFYKPFDPTPFPGQHPIDDGKCGSDGYFCGGPGQHPADWQWPGQTINGGAYDRGDVESCMHAFANAGLDAAGMWGVDVRTLNSVSILSDDIIEDRSVGPNIVIINSVGVLGVTRYRFLNPDALYCVKNTNVFEDVRITSCHTHNVVFGQDVNVLSTVNSQTVACP